MSKAIEAARDHRGLAKGGGHRSLHSLDQILHPGLLDRQMHAVDLHDFPALDAKLNKLFGQLTGNLHINSFNSLLRWGDAPHFNFNKSKLNRIK